MAMSTQAVQTEEHDEKQDDVGHKRDNGAESDAIQVVHTAVYPPRRAEL
jgi:hypothetical protein